MEHIFSKREALAFGWQQTKKHFVVLAGAVLLATVVQVLVNYVTDLASDHSMLFLEFLLSVIGILVQLVIGMGMIRLALHYSEDKKIDLHQAFRPTSEFPQYMLGSLFYLGIVLVGIILLIVPGIIWGIRYQFFPYLIVEKGMTAREALRESSKMTKGHKWSLFVLALIVLLLNIIGGITIIGFILTVPISFMAMAYVYRKLHDAHIAQGGESTAVEVQKIELTAAELESKEI